MQRRLVEDPTFEKEQTTPAAALLPTAQVDHDDKPNGRPESLTEQSRDLADTQSAEESRVLPPLRHASDSSATSALPPHMSSDEGKPTPGASTKDVRVEIRGDDKDSGWRRRLQNPWICSPYTLTATLLGFAALFLMAQSFLTKQLDVKGCGMAYMRPNYKQYDQFDTEHTRFASKYSLYLYNEGGIDEDFKVRLACDFECTR